MDVAPSTPSATLDAASHQFETRWQTLVSTTNWEKGRIIAQWRAAMIAADAPAGEYSDDAWSRRVGGVTGQHVGRLRRVWERFGTVYETYAGLFWSHFQAGLDWSDPELWLEGAVQNGWSISEMRQQRWEAQGAPDDMKPRAEDVVAAEMDEDFLDDAQAAQRLVEVGDVRTHDEDQADAAAPWKEGTDAASDHEPQDQTSDDAPPRSVRPFENLPELPDDLADAFESFKLAILRHKASDWSEVDRGAVIQTLDALKTLAMAPSGEE